MKKDLLRKLFILAASYFLCFENNISAQCSGDVTPPVFTSCPTSLSDNNAPGFCGRNISYAFPTATDNCQPAVQIPFTNEVHAVPSYSENGYTVTSTRRINVFAAEGVPNAPIIAPETLPATWTLTNDNGHTFTMTSLEMGAFNFTSNPQTDNFVGVKGDGSTVSFSFTSTAAYGTMELVTFPASFTNLVSMHWAATINIYDNFRMVTLPKINRTSGLAPGAFFPVGNTTVTYVAEDEAGNMSAPCTFTVTVTDNEPPTFTRPADKTIFADANCNYNSAVSNTGIPINVRDNCGGTLTPTFSDNISHGPCLGRHVITRTWSLMDTHGNHAADQVQTITVLDNTPPTISCPPTVTVQCASAVPAHDFAGGSASDNCSTATVTWLTDVITNQTCANRYTITRTYKATDACNNSATCTQTITVFDDTPPTFTCPANKVIPFTDVCTYNSTPTNTGSPTNVNDNCGGAVLVTYTDVVSQCGNNILFTRTWNATDICGNSTTCDQTITVTDNNTLYIIYATKEAKFGEDNLINGDVGVTDANGKAEFKKGDVLNPNHVYAKNINVQTPSMVTNKHFIPASGGPNPPFYSYTGGGLSGNYTQTINGAVPAGNYKELTIKKGLTVTVNGSNYGKIKIEEGADVTFTSSSIDMEELTVGKGKNNGTTNIHFTGCTGVRVKDRVTIEEDCRVNVGGPKVNIYLGDTKKDEENFTVKGDDSQVTLNIMIPNGKLKVNGGNSNAIMTGWFIVEKLESDGKNVSWNNYGCAPPPPLTSKGGTEEVLAVKGEKAKVEGFVVKVSPNPTASEFSIRVISNSDELVSVRILDLSGKVMDVKSNINSESTITLGGNLRGGTYFAEVIQGSNRQIVKLMKLK